MNISKMLQMIPFRLFYSVCSLMLIAGINFAQNSTCNLQNGNLVVTNTNDSGLGSLRNAIECANKLVGSNRIIFNINGGGIQTIFVGSTTGEPLPSLVDAGTIIDATTQNGDVARPRIVLDGSRTVWTVPINGLFVLANNCEVYGLEIRNFPGDGIDIFNAQNVIIGKPNKGNVIYSNGEENDFYTNASPNGPWEGSGIVLRNESKFCQIQSNVIGTDAAFSTNISNEYCGILIQGASSNNIIGGNSIDSRNIIAYNMVGIRIDGSEVCSIYSNSIFCNDEDGIQFSNSGNANKSVPIIERANNQVIAGKSKPQDFIEIFVNDSKICEDKPCQGRVFIGRTITQRDSTWSFNVSNLDFGDFDLITATATDVQGNTSGFSTCRSLISTTSTCANAQGIITVTNTNDDGVGSLRAAIDCANNNAGANTIVFNISGNSNHVIYVGSTTGQPLPPLIDATTIIDGSTQPGFGVNNNFEPKIILDGIQYAWNYPHDALLILGNRCEVYGLEFRNFPDDGIDITGAQFVKIGAPKKGNVIYNCGIPQDFFNGAIPRGAWEGCGIVLQGNTANCKISSNIIGTNYSRTLVIGNEFCGISLNDNESNHIIGGSTQEEGNIIAYNPSGILLETGATKIRISKNSFICNDTVAISLVDAANFQKSPPTVAAFTPQQIKGKATAGDLVEVFISSTSLCPNQPCQGQIYLGSTTTNANGDWVLNGPFTNSTSISQTVVLTATATDNQGNTSPFANCFTTNVANCTNFKASIVNVRGETCDRDNGSFSVNVTGGTAPYTYNIGRGPTLSPDFSNLNAGTYSVTITDAATCQATQAIRIEKVDPPSAIIIDKEDAICGQPTGMFTVVPLRGLFPFSYDIGNGSTNDSKFDDLAPGEYVVTITDASGCATYQIVAIGAIETMKLTIADIVDATCGLNNGRVTASVEGGITPIVYKIGDRVFSQPVFENLAAGTYRVIATDANGCTAIHDFTIQASAPLALSVANIKEADCNQRGGAITVSAVGGVPPILFNYGNGITANPTFSNLFAGTYLITATDSKGCSAVTTARVEAGSLFDVSIENIKDASCGLSNAAFVVKVENGQLPYKYKINGASITESPEFTGLSAGQYSLTVTDARGCTVIKEIVITNIAPLEINIVNVVDATCTNGGGSFSIFPSGGVLPVTYDIGLGQTSNPFFSDLAPGNYTIKAIDALGCTTSSQVTIDLTGNLDISSNIRDATCGQANGSFEIKVTTGAAPFQYNLGNGNTNSNVFSNLQAGNYTVTVTDRIGCQAVQTIEIKAGVNLTARISQPSAATCGQANGSFNIEIISGTAPYTYNIGRGVVNDPSFKNLAAGNYAVTISDAKNCNTIQNVTIRETSPVRIAIAAKENATCGQTNGKFEVKIESGTPPYRYDIGNGFVNLPVFDSLAAGRYTVTVKDSVGCSSTQNVEITQESNAVVATVTDLQIATCGQSNGSFSVNTTAGVAPFTYSLGSGTTTTNSNFRNLSEGLYRLQITDAKSCTFIQEVYVDETAPVTVNIVNKKEATCGDTNGAFSVEINSGLAPFLYNIGNGSSNDSIFQNLMGGLYKVTINDANGCSTTQNVIIEADPPLTLESLEQEPATCGNSNGRFKVNIVGGARPYTFAIPGKRNTAGIFEGLAGGIYSLTITDSKGCTLEQSVDIEAPNPVTATIRSVTPSVCGSNNGTFELNASGGTAPYRYQLGSTTQQSPNFIGLRGGSYEVTVTDGLACSTVITVKIEETSALTATITNKTDDFCGNGGGSFTVVATNGLSPYSYNIGTAPTSNNTFRNISPGNYTITVTDANGCKTVAGVSIISSSNLNLQLLSQRRPSCGQPNGAITVSANGGVTPYSFSLGNNTTTSPIFEDLSPGKYVVKVTDGNGCTATVNIDLPVENTPPTVSIESKQDVSCRQTNGSFTLNALGGASPYSYNLGRGATTNPTFNNLAAGTYAVTITDANACSVIQVVNIISAPDLRLTIQDVENARCGLPNGVFKVAASGGNPPYLYDIGNGSTNSPIFSNLVVGNYTVTVTDARSCKETHDITIENVNLMTVTLSNRRDASCGAANGSFTAIVSGGKTPYRFDLGAGSTNNTRFENLVAGNYQLTVTDNEGCVKVTPVEIKGTGSPVVAITEVVEATCGDKNGRFSLSASGGKSPYTFNIGNGASNRNTFTDLSPGQYTVTTTDANGCTATTNINLTSNGIVPVANFILDSTGVAIQLTSMASNADSVVWDLGDGVIYGGENTITHRYDSSGVYTICLTVNNSCGTDTYCQQVVYEVASSNMAEISGQIYRENQDAVKSVNVNCTGENGFRTGLEGTYNFKNLASGKIYQVRPEKKDDLPNGISTYDIFLLNSHVLTTDTLDSPYKIIAADINKSGTVTTFDVLSLRRVLLGLDTIFPSGNTSWRFIDANFAFQDALNPFLEPLPEKIDVNLTRTIKDVNFVAVKIGDLNNSAILNTSPTENRTRKVATIQATISPTQDAITFSIPPAWLGTQFTLEFDPTLIRISDWALGDLQALSKENFGWNWLEEGKITVSWNATHQQQGTTLITLKMARPNDINWSTAFRITSSITPIEAFTATETYSNIDLKILNHTQEQLSLLGVAPNPFKEKFEVHFSVPVAEKVKFTLFDAVGKHLYFQWIDAAAGYNSIPVEASNLPNGLIYYQLETPTETKVGKVISVQ